MVYNAAPWKLQAKITLLSTSKANLDSSINSMMANLKDVEVTVENAGQKDAESKSTPFRTEQNSAEKMKK